MEASRVVVVEAQDDYCIACGTDAKVQAYVYARYRSGVTAAFCASHGRQHRASLIEQHAHIVDMSHLLHEGTP